MIVSDVIAKLKSYDTRLPIMYYDDDVWYDIYGINPVTNLVVSYVNGTPQMSKLTFAIVDILRPYTVKGFPQITVEQAINMLSKIDGSLELTYYDEHLNPCPIKGFRINHCVEYDFTLHKQTNIPLVEILL